MMVIVGRVRKLIVYKQYRSTDIGWCQRVGLCGNNHGVTKAIMVTYGLVCDSHIVVMVVIVIEVWAMTITCWLVKKFLQGTFHLSN